jgi:hypothetical protein
MLSLLRSKSHLDGEKRVTDRISSSLKMMASAGQTSRLRNFLTGSFSFN